MRQTADHNLGAPLVVMTQAPESAVAGDPHVRETLKRCSALTRKAAREYQKTGNVDCVPVIIRGLIEHYIDPDARAKLNLSDDNVRLREDLAIDSLTMLEIVFVAEDVFQVSIDNEELRPFKTVGDVNRFVLAKLSASTI